MRRQSEHPLIVVLAPEPPAWLDQLPELDGADVRVIRLWPVVRRAGTAWAHGRADRRIEARFALRSLLDRLAARTIRDDVQAVYATSLCARRTFAAAKRVSPAIECHLVEDLPDLRQLHEDLDHAAAAHPDAQFLLRHRATSHQLARQEAERVLADVLHVRSHFAAAARVSSRRPPDAIRTIGHPPMVGPRRALNSDHPTLYLGGLATARAGTYEALGVLDAIPEATLIVRVGEGLEPAALLTHPRVQVIERGANAPLGQIDVLLAPSWCEMHVPEITAAAELGVPIVATTRAAGLTNLSEAGATVEPGDINGLIWAIRSLVARAQNARPESR